MATKKLSGDYEAHSKDELQTEADSRGLNITGTGSSGAVVKDDLVKALKASDSAGPVAPGAAPAAKPLSETAPGNIPRVQETVSVGGNEPTPPMEEFTEGNFIRKSDNEEYALATVRQNGLSDRTHRLMNTAHYWEGTEAQFCVAFTEKGGKVIEMGDYPPKDAEEDYLDDKQKAELLKAAKHEANHK